MSKLHKPRYRLPVFYPSDDELAAMCKLLRPTTPSEEEAIRSALDLATYYDIGAAEFNDDQTNPRGMLPELIAKQMPATGRKAVLQIVKALGKVRNGMLQVPELAYVSDTFAALRDQLPTLIAELNMVLDTPANQPPADPRLERVADYAVEVFIQFGRPLVTRRGSPLCKLAAHLYGDPRASMEHWCREAVKRAKLRNE